MIPRNQRKFWYDLPVKPDFELTTPSTTLPQRPVNRKLAPAN